jgi:hypothetical protein
MQLSLGLNFPFDVVAVRPWIELETASAIFCKRGRETAVTYCLPPWTFIGRDNRIEMVDMKFGFWRECHIERPTNIIVAEHAFVSRVMGGMDTTWMTEQDYLHDPARRQGDCFPMIIGPLRANRELPALAAIKTNILSHEVQHAYKSLDTEMAPFTNDLKNMTNDLFRSCMDASPTLWSGETLNNRAIPRVCSLGRTRQQSVEVSNGTPIRVIPGATIENTGHMKKLDSVELIGSLSGFAQSQVRTPMNFF